MGNTASLTMEAELKDKFGKEHLVKSLDKILKLVCCHEMMTEFHLQDDMYVLFEIKELSEKYIK